MTYNRSMNTDDVRQAAIDALQRAEDMADPERKNAWSSIGTGYARIYAADVARS